MTSLTLSKQEVRYFHGGPSGRERGTFLLPPSITGAPSCSEFGAAGVHRRDRVYVTTDRAAAVVWAAGAKRSTVYEVEPLGAIEPDPDCSEPGLSFQCEKARVLRVTKLRPAELRAAQYALMLELAR